VKLPIRVRLTAWYALLLALLLVGVGAFVVGRLRSDLGREVDDSLASAGRQIARGYAAEGPKDFFDVASTVFPTLPSGAAVAQIVGPSGRVAIGYGGAQAKRPLASRRLVAGALAGRRSRDTVSLNGEQFRVLALPVRRGAERQALVLAKSLRNRNRSVSRLLVLLLIAFPVAVLAAVAGGWLLARRALRPVEIMTSHADRIGIDRVDERVPVPPAEDEIAHLATTLNAMLERLQRGVEERRRLVAHASHELRTPLAAMRSELDVSLHCDDLPPAARAVLDSVGEEVERMTALVANLLTLARIDEGRLELRHEVIDVGALLQALADRLMPLTSGMDVELDLAEPVTTIGDPERLREVATNLVVNAIKFSGSGACVRIATWRNGDEAGFLVSDTGPGIAPAAQAHIFDRFWRAEESRGRDSGGSGLGLAICREVVEAHGGRIVVESDEGRGACFRVALRAHSMAHSIVPAPALA
jgi:two-component system, OmpR family, sensor kinase